jgi:hypothetical protein
MNQQKILRYAPLKRVTIFWMAIANVFMELSFQIGLMGFYVRYNTVLQGPFQIYKFQADRATVEVRVLLRRRQGPLSKQGSSRGTWLYVPGCGYLFWPWLFVFFWLKMSEILGQQL